MSSFALPKRTHVPMLAADACFDLGHQSITRPAPGVARANDPIRKHPVPNRAHLQLAASAEAIPVPAEPVVLEQDPERRSDGIDRPDRIERDERIDAKIEDRKTFCAVVCRIGPSLEKSKRRVQELLILRRASLVISGNNPPQPPRERSRHVLNIKYGVAAKSLAVAAIPLGRHAIVGVDEAVACMRSREEANRMSIGRPAGVEDHPPREHVGQIRRTRGPKVANPAGEFLPVPRHVLCDRLVHGSRPSRARVEAARAAWIRYFSTARPSSRTEIEPLAAGGGVAGL